jgi:pimeloyl-ACP methyl ester carboxylesterase
MKRILMLALGIVLAAGLGVRAIGQTLFTVEVKGKGKPVIFIHGLYCTGDVWKETVERYQKNYECHILTLAGFGGNTPALKDNFLGSVKDEVIAYVKTSKLKKPVIIGHSMGGFLAFWAASSAPDLFSGIVAVDGLPFLPAIQIPGATSESSKPMATNMKNMMSNLTPEMTKANQKMYLPMMITDTARISQVAQMAMKSDPKTIGEVMYELFTTDLRPDVAKITCPVQLQGAWIAYKDYGATHDSVMKGYLSQVASVKNATVELNDKARHFIFYDDPAWFYEKTDFFLKSL